jgi:hypothetical protein
MTGSTFAQPSGMGNWLSYAINGKISERWSTVGDYQLRNYELTGDFQQLLLRTNLQYEINSHVEIGCGYAFSLAANYSGEDKTTGLENRITQQLIHKILNKRVVLAQRLRVEERFLSDRFQLRFRYQFGGRYWWNEKHRWYAGAFDELFLLADGLTFDQNRIFTGIGYRFNDHFRLETGNLYIRYRSGSRNQLFTQLVHSFHW